MGNGIPMEMYSERAVRHFMAPSNTGPLREINGVGCASSDTSKDIIELSIHVTPSGIIDGVRCRTHGCSAAVAAGSALSELVDGRAVSDSLRLRPEEVLAAIGGLPSRQARYALLPLLAIKAAVENHRERCCAGAGQRVRHFRHRRLSYQLPGARRQTSSAA